MAEYVMMCECREGKQVLRKMCNQRREGTVKHASGPYNPFPSSSLRQELRNKGKGYPEML